MKWAIDCAAALGADTLSRPAAFDARALLRRRPDGGREEALGRLPARHRRPCRPAGRHHRSGGAEPLRMLSRQHDGGPVAPISTRSTIRNIKAMYDTFHCQHRGGRIRSPPSPTTCATSSTSTSRRTTAACPGAATFRGRRPSRRSASSGYDGWLTIEAFGRGLKDLAAATKVWRDFAESPEAVYREGYDHIRKGWKRAGANRAGERQDPASLGYFWVPS